MQYPALFGQFLPEIFVMCKNLVPIMLTGSGSVLMAGLTHNIRQHRGPLIGWWGPGDYTIFRGLINVWSRLHTDYSTRQDIISQVLIIMNEQHQSLSKYARQEIYYLYCIDGVSCCWIKLKCFLALKICFSVIWDKVILMNGGQGKHAPWFNLKVRILIWH